MKTITYIFMVGFLLSACKNDDDGTVTKNQPPTAPVLTYPSNNLLCIEDQVVFEWAPATDPDGDALTYKVEIAKDRAFTEMVENESVQGTSVTISLPKGIAYYWRVKAVDSYTLAGEFSPINQFYVEGDGVSNYLPFAPRLISPTMDVSVDGTEVMLEWAGSDIDEDPLMYDVYLGTENPPTMVSEDLTESSLSTTVEAGNTYYWQVVVKDESGGETKGQTWSFTTE